MNKPKLIVIHKFLNPTEAHIAKTLLEDAGINAFLLDEQSSYSIGTPIVLGGYRLAISDSHIADASKILKHFVHLNSVQEPEQKIVCPKCSSTLVINRNPFSFISTLGFLLMSFMLFSKRNSSYYRCKRCRHKWNENKRA